MKLLALAAAAAAVWIATSARRLPPPDPYWFDALHDHEFWPLVDRDGQLVP